MLKRLLPELCLAFVVACSDSTTNPGSQISSSTLSWLDVSTTAGNQVPAGLDFYAAVTLHDRIYVLDYTGRLYHFDHNSGAWSERVALPTFRTESGLTVAEGRLYVLGGQLGEGVGSALVEAYDPNTNAWLSRAPLLQAVSKPGVATVDDAIYVIGGDAPTGPSKLVQRYEIGSDRWTLVTEMPTRRCALALAVIHGKILAIGGIGGGWGNWWHIVNSVEEYDPVTDSWIAKPFLPEARDQLTAVSWRDRVFVIGGRTTFMDDRASKTVFEYDPSTETWTERNSLNHDRYYHGSTILQGAIFVIGGRTDLSEIEVVVERGAFR